MLLWSKFEDPYVPRLFPESFVYRKAGFTEPENNTVAPYAKNPSLSVTNCRDAFRYRPSLIQPICLTISPEISSHNNSKRVNNE